MAQSQIATKIATNTFVGGMNKDLDKSVRPSNMYFDAQNIRVTADKTGTTGALVNIEGNSLLISTEIETGQYICGYCWVRNWLVVFTSTNYDNAPDDEGESHIYAFPFIGSDIQENDYIGGSALIYDDTAQTTKLDFSVANRIQAVGRYENENIIKIYFTDGYNNVRWVNIKSSTLSTQTVDKFDFIPDVVLSKPTIDSIVSGSINVGMVQYAYQYYIEHDAETLYSPCSDLVHLTTSSEYLGNTETYKGSDSLDSNNIYVNSGKGVKINITNSNTDYTGIRVVAIHYNSLGTEPTVRLFIDQPITSDATSFNFIDIGTSLDTYTYQEFAVLSRNLFKAETLNTKDDYLFAGNITDEYFDIGDYDARAYRFLTEAITCKLYHGYDGSDSDPYIYCTGGGTIEESTWSTSEGWVAATGLIALDGDDIEDIHEETDCVNLFNDYSKDGDTDYEYKYQFNSTTLGGSGYNIDYKFVCDATTGFILDENTFYGSYPLMAVNSSAGTSYSNFASPLISSSYRGYMHDETYRFGIVWYDTRGRKSYVRWIGDIRFPNYSELPYMDWTDGEATDIHGRNLAIQFEIKNIPTDVEYYQIVRVKKESLNDKNIITQGILKGAFETGTPDVYYQKEFTGAHHVEAADDYCLLSSPDITFGTDITYKAGDVLRVIARTEDFGSTKASSDFYYVASITTNPNLNVGKARTWRIIPTPLTNTTLTINDAVVISPGDNTYNLSGSSYDFKTYYTNTPRISGTALLIDKSGDGDVAWVGNNDVSDTAYRYLCNYIRNNWESMHGGNTYISRSRNTYIAASSFLSTEDEYITVYGGDTFINYFDHLSSTADLTQEKTSCYAEVLLFPVQSNYNLDLRNDTSYKFSLKVTNFPLSQETSGLQLTADATPEEYDQEYDYYRYNTVYSQENTTISFFGKPIDELYALQDYFDTRVRSSDKKTNGESSDSWFLFRTNNYIDVDSQYGSLTSLNVYKDTLMFWQPHGFGVLSVNPRSLIQDDSGNSLVLGTGGVLDRYDYVSRTVGTSCKYGVVATDNSVYWVDDTQKEIMQYSSGMRGSYNVQSGQNELSKTKGLSSYLKSLDYISDVVSVVDRVNNEVLFTITPGIKGVVSTVAAGTTTITMTDSDDYFTANEIVRMLDTAYKVSSSSSTELGISDAIPDFATDDIVWFGSNQEAFTISFSEQINAFGSFYSFIPCWYFDCNNKFFSVKSHYESAAINKNIYLHNSGDRGYFYGTAYDSSITLHINQDYAATKVFDNMFWDSKTTDPATNDAELFTTTWDKIWLYNDYQNVQYGTGTPTFTALEDLDLVYKTAADVSELAYDRRERMFTTALPRSRVNQDVTANEDIFDPTNITNQESYGERLRDKYLTAKFTWVNDTNNYKFVCPFISTQYRYSIR